MARPSGAGAGYAVVPAEDGTPTGGVDHRAFRGVLDRLAGTLVDLYALDDVLQQLGADITRVLGVAGAGVMLDDDDGRLRFVSTSDEVLHELEALQIDLDDGPCLLAYRSGKVVICDDVQTDPRFPRFGPRALETGMAAVYSFPMLLEQQVIGALNLYASEPAAFTAEQIELGGTFATVATCYLVNARDVEQKDLLNSQLQHALTARVLIEQAKGFVVARLGVEPAGAFELLRGYARRHQLAVRAVAHRLLHGEMEAEELLRR